MSLVADQADLSPALQVRTSISDFYVRHLISIGQRLRIPTPLRVPNPRPVILVIGEEYSGKSSLISYLADNKLKSEDMCINIFVPYYKEVNCFMDSLADILPAVHACFHDHGFPTTYLRCTAFNSYVHTNFSLRQAQATPLENVNNSMVRISPTGRSVYYSPKQSVATTKQIHSSLHSSSYNQDRGDESRGSASIYNSINRLEASLAAENSISNRTLVQNSFQQPNGPACPFIFIEIPFFYRSVITNSSSKGLISSFSNSSKRSELVSAFSKSQLRVFENVVKTLFHQADAILFTTSCDVDAKCGGFSAENNQLLYYISSIDELFRKTTILVTKCDRIVERQSCIDVIQECSSALALLSPYRRFKIQLIYIPYYSELKNAKEHAEALRLKQDIFNTINLLDTQTKMLVDTSNVVLEITGLEATLHSRALPSIDEKQSLNKSEFESKPKLQESTAQIGSSLALSADKHDRFVSSSTATGTGLPIMTSLQQSYVMENLQASQALVLEMASKLISQCSAVVRILNPTAYDIDGMINQSLTNLGIKPECPTTAFKGPTQKIGELLASTEELNLSLHNLAITQNKAIICECRAVVLNILRRIDHNIRTARKVRIRNMLLTSLRVFLVILAILLSFMMGSASKLLGADFLQTRCYVHHLERNHSFKGERFEGSFLEIVACAFLYEIGVLGLRKIIDNVTAAICLWLLPPLLVLIVILLDAFYFTKPLEGEDLASLKLESDRILKPILIMLDSVINREEDVV